LATSSRLCDLPCTAGEDDGGTRLSIADGVADDLENLYPARRSAEETDLTFWLLQNLPPSPTRLLW
jgi:hypothetical protein